MEQENKHNNLDDENYNEKTKKLSLTLNKN